MKKIYNIVMNIFYAIMGLLIVITLIILCYDKLPFLHPTTNDTHISNNSQTTTDDIIIKDENNNTTSPISVVKAMELVNRFANPYANKYYEYRELVNLDGKDYHVISSRSASPLLVELQTGDIFVYDEKDGLLPLADVIPLLIDHRSYTGGKQYAAGYEFFHKYMSVVIDKCDRKKANSLMDTSYFETNVPKDKQEYFKKIVQTTNACQENMFFLVEEMDRQYKAKKIEDYSFVYIVSLTDEYKDETGAKWVDISIELTCYYIKDGYIDTAGEHYSISVKECKGGWKVARISES